MPGLNATGPRGQGPRTGRGLGRCTGGPVDTSGWGAGRGWGRGPCGGGRGRGCGWGRGMGYGPVGWPQGAAPPAMDLEAEAAALRQRLAELEAAMAQRQPEEVD